MCINNQVKKFLIKSNNVLERDSNGVRETDFHDFRITFTIIFDIVKLLSLRFI